MEAAEYNPNVLTDSREECRQKLQEALKEVTGNQVIIDIIAATVADLSEKYKLPSIGFALDNERTSLGMDVKDESTDGTKYELRMNPQLIQMPEDQIGSDLAGHVAQEKIRFFVAHEVYHAIDSERRPNTFMRDVYKGNDLLDQDQQDEYDQSHKEYAANLFALHYLQGLPSPDLKTLAARKLVILSMKNQLGQVKKRRKNAA